MNEFVMKDFGFTALDPVARCAISGGDSEYGILGELLEDLLEGLASKLGAAGILVSMLAKNTKNPFPLFTVAFRSLEAASSNAG
jgi:hypothetical protein